MTPQAEDRVPVLIVGGSLVGLSSSVFLGRLGVRHVLVEKHPGTSIHPRGRGNNLRTMELFRTAGAEPLIRQAASVLADNHGILQAESLTSDNAEWLFREIDPGGRLSGISPSGWCLCSQNDLEPVLLDYARKMGGDLRFSTELVSFAQDDDGVTCELMDRETGERSTIRTDYLLAADGPRSPVRDALGIGHTGRGDLFANISATFRAKRLADAVGDRYFIACYLTNPDADGVLLPVDNQENWVFHAPWHPERGETPEDFTDQRLAAHIRTAVGVPDLEVEITGRAPWRAAERVADSYGRGRVLLAGDSCHEMSPTGAFGSNTGIQDAHNLAWKLAAVTGGWAGPELLETYEAERRPVAVATSERASARSAEHAHPGYAPPAGGGPQKGVLVVALGYRYPEGAFLGGDPGRPVVPEDFRPVAEPGGRSPHVWVTSRDGKRRSTLDLYERSMVLLTGDGPEGAAWHEAAGAVAERLGVPVEAYRLGDSARAELTPEGDTDWAALHGMSPRGAILVRPDGFVAWRSRDAVPDPEQTLSGVLTSVLRLG